MDEEFGKHSKLTSDRVDHLHAFGYSKGAVSESQKFMELYDRWAEVYFDLESVTLPPTAEPLIHILGSWE